MFNLSAQVCMFQSFFHRVFSNFQRQYTMREVFLSGFFMDTL